MIAKILALQNKINDLEDHDWRTWERSSHPSLFLLWLVRYKHVFSPVDWRQLNATWVTPSHFWEKQVIFEIIKCCLDNSAIYVKPIRSLVSNSRSAYRDLGFYILLVLNGYRIDYGNLYSDGSSLYSAERCLKDNQVMWENIHVSRDMSLFWPILFNHYRDCPYGVMLNRELTLFMVKNKINPYFDSIFNRIAYIRQVLLRQLQLLDCPEISSHLIHRQFDFFVWRMELAERYWNVSNSALKFGAIDNSLI